MKKVADTVTSISPSLRLVDASLSPPLTSLNCSSCVSHPWTPHKKRSSSLSPSPNLYFRHHQDQDGCRLPSLQDVLWQQMEWCNFPETLMIPDLLPLQDEVKLNLSSAKPCSYLKSKLISFSQEDLFLNNTNEIPVTIKAERKDPPSMTTHSIVCLKDSLWTKPL